MKKFYFYIFSFIFMFFGACKKDKNVENSDDYEYPYFIIEPIKDTVKTNEYSKYYLLLGNPVFYNKNSSVQVAVDMSNNDSLYLKKDLSNIDRVPFRLFQNLKLDSINQKFIKSDSLTNRRVLFFKKFKKPGDHMIRGVLVEYYGDYDPLTLEFNGKVGDTAKTYFEVKVHVKDSAKANLQSR